MKRDYHAEAVHELRLMFSELADLLSTDDADEVETCGMLDLIEIQRDYIRRTWHEEPPRPKARPKPHAAPQPPMQPTDPHRYVITPTGAQLLLPGEVPPTARMKGGTEQVRMF